MAYTLKQTVGKLADAAQAYAQARRDGDSVLMASIFTQATGKAPAWNDPANAWCVFNAPDCIASFTGMTQAETDRAFAWHPYDDEKFTHACRRIAEKRSPGTWIVQYEY